MNKSNWSERALDFLQRPVVEGALCPSTTLGPNTLYGFAYSVLGQHYLSAKAATFSAQLHELAKYQRDPQGLVIGPELEGLIAKPGAAHDLEHLCLHSTITMIPICQEFHISLRPIEAAHKFCDLDYLQEWCRQRNWKNAWLEGNNILFVGQLLVYLRDAEGYPGAQEALNWWFEWLDAEVDPITSLWGTQGHCSADAAVYGGYHQLLVYWHEDHPIANPEGLVDTVLSLRHSDGGFNLSGNSGACEDVDSVDILVNCYKRWDYRRAEIRLALWNCANHILATQNADGGFPYNRDNPQSHMGIPGTEAEANVSCSFPTWFRVHTLALCAEIIPEHPELQDTPFQFNSYLSMGWHRSPANWSLIVSEQQKEEEKRVERQFSRERRMFEMRKRLGPTRSLAKRIKRMVRNFLK